MLLAVLRGQGTDSNLRRLIRPPTLALSPSDFYYPFRSFFPEQGTTMSLIHFLCAVAPNMTTAAVTGQIVTPRPET